LKAILAQVRADVWIVLGGFQEGERWLSEHRVRAIVVGSGTERISLPCLGTDYQSACRHAVGVLRSKGHDRIALLLPESKGPESSPYVDGFLEGFTGSTQREDARSRVQFHDGTVRGVCSVLRNLFRSAPPSALLVARPKHALNAMTYLHDAGLHVPRDVSIIALGYEPYLDNVIPPITHYEIAWPSFAKRLFRMVMRLATTGNLPGHPVLVMPEFRKGETVLAKS
jgi:LacI family transcriptional regulator